MVQLFGSSGGLAGLRVWETCGDLRAVRLGLPRPRMPLVQVKFVTDPRDVPPADLRLQQQAQHTQQDEGEASSAKAIAAVERRRVAIALAARLQAQLVDATYEHVGFGSGEPEPAPRPCRATSGCERVTGLSVPAK